MHLSMLLCSVENLIRNSLSLQSSFKPTEEYHNNEFSSKAVRLLFSRWKMDMVEMLSLKALRL